MKIFGILDALKLLLRPFLDQNSNETADIHMRIEQENVVGSLELIRKRLVHSVCGHLVSFSTRHLTCMQYACASCVGCILRAGELNLNTSVNVA